MLAKQGVGIRDVWGETGLTKGEVRDQAAAREEDAGALPMQRDYLGRLAAHFIAVGLANGKPPPIRLLAVHEAAGGDAWKPLAVSPAEEIAALKAADPTALAPARVAEVLASAGDWPRLYRFASSWFEDDASVEALLPSKVGPPGDW